MKLQTKADLPICTFSTRCLRTAWAFCQASTEKARSIKKNKEPSPINYVGQGFFVYFSQYNLIKRKQIEQLPPRKTQNKSENSIVGREIIIYNLSIRVARFFLKTFFSPLVRAFEKMKNGGEKMNKEKKEYQPAELLLIRFDTSDVIATSSTYRDPDENAWV